MFGREMTIGPMNIAPFCFKGAMVVPSVAPVSGYVDATGEAHKIYGKTHHGRWEGPGARAIREKGLRGYSEDTVVMFPSLK